MLNILASLGAITAIATSPLPLSLQATEAAAPAPQVSEPAGLSEADRSYPTRREKPNVWKTPATRPRLWTLLAWR